jgi:hypothetical protein
VRVGRCHDRHQDVVHHALDLLRAHPTHAGGGEALPPERLQHRTEQRQPVLVDRLSPASRAGADLVDGVGERAHERGIEPLPELLLVPGRADQAGHGALLAVQRLGPPLGERDEVGTHGPAVGRDGDQREPRHGGARQRRHAGPAAVDAGLPGAGAGGDAVAVEPPPALLGQDVDRDREQLLGQLRAQRPPGGSGHDGIP